MTASVSLVTAMIGAALARLAERTPPRADMLEAVAGTLLLGGFAAIGYTLPML